MSVEGTWQTCYRLLKRPVLIRTCDGSMYHGVIATVDGERVYLQPSNGYRSAHEETRDLGPYPYDPGSGPEAFWGGLAGSLLGIGLGSILSIYPPPYYGPPFPEPYYPPEPFPGGYYGYGPYF